MRGVIAAGEGERGSEELKETEFKIWVARFPNESVALRVSRAGIPAIREEGVLRSKFEA